MPTTVHRYKWGFNRRQVFRRGGMRLWIGGIYKTGIELELEQLKPGTSSVWTLIWSGVVSYTTYGATIKTLKLDV